MSFEKYKKVPTPFERYYDQFLQNVFLGHRFQITLLAGDSAMGVPSAGMIVNANDPDVTFHFCTEDGSSYRIPFREIKEAERLVECFVHATDNFHGRGEFSLYVTSAEAETARGADAPITVKGALGIRSHYMKGSGIYKFLVVRQRVFGIKVITDEPDQMLSLQLEPLRAE